MGEFRCYHCQDSLPREDFYARPAAKLKPDNRRSYYSYCKQCTMQKQKGWKAARVSKAEEREALTAKIRAEQKANKSE